MEKKDELEKEAKALTEKSLLPHHTLQPVMASVYIQKEQANFAH